MVHVTERKSGQAPQNGKSKQPQQQSRAADPVQPTPPDGGWGWVVVFASFMVHVITDGVTYSCGLFHVEFVHYFESSEQAASWILSLLVGITYCSGPFSSFLVNKYGCQAVTIMGTVLSSACILASVWATSIIQLYFTIGIGTGLGFGLIYLPAIVSVTVYFEKYRSLATGIAVCGSGLGTVVFSEIISQLIAYYGSYKRPMMILSALVLNCIVFGIMFRPLKPNKSPESVPLKNVTKNGTANSTNSNNTLVVGDAKQMNNNNNNGSGERRSSVNIAGKKFSSLKISNSASNNIRLALSQPILASKDNGRPNNDETFTRAFRGSGIMNRSDVFLRSSIHNIRKRSESLTNDSEENVQRFRLSLRSLPNGTSHGPKAVEAADGAQDDADGNNIIKRMLKFSLLKDPLFIIFTISNFCTSIGFNVPYLFLIPQATANGVEKLVASRLLAIIGIANALGRIILGYVSDKPWINRLFVYNVCLTICGLATALSPFCSSFTSFAVYASIYGFTAGAYVGLTSVCLVDLVGLDRLTNAFGLVLLFQGIASFLGPPIAGSLADNFHSYDPGFYVAGTMIAISGVMLYIIPPIQKKMLLKDERLQRINTLP